MNKKSAPYPKQPVAAIGNRARRTRKGRRYKMSEKLMTESELAKRLSISKSTLSMLRSKGELPFRLIGTCIRYEPDEVDEWLRRCGVNASKEKPEHE